MSSRNFAKVVPAFLPPVLNMTIIVAGIFLLAPPVEQSWAWPFPVGLLVSRQLLGLAALFSMAFTIALSVIATLVVPGSGRRINLSALVAYQALVFAAIWLLLPIFDKAALLWLLLVLVVLLMFAFQVTGRRVFYAAKTSGKRLGGFLPEDLLLVAPVLLAWWLMSDAAAWQETSKNLLRSVLVYPVYAYVQLLLFLALPARLMKEMGVPGSAIMLGIAANFSLLHTPNPWLMMATGAAMVVWSGQWLRGRPLWSLALIMGVSAAMVSTLLPRSFTGEMRIGPDFIEHYIEWSCVESAETC